MPSVIFMTDSKDNINPKSFIFIDSIRYYVLLVQQGFERPVAFRLRLVFLKCGPASVLSGAELYSRLRIVILADDGEAGGLHFVLIVYTHGSFILYQFIISYLNVLKSETDPYHKTLEAVNLFVNGNLSSCRHVLQICNRLLNVYKFL